MANATTNGTAAAFTDEELTMLALAADVRTEPDAGVAPIGGFLGQRPIALPDWYMPAATARARRWRVPVVLAIVGAFLIIEAFGLCSTFGPLVFA